MSMVNDIAEELEDDGVGTVGTNIFCGKMPDAPDICIAVSQYGGQPIDEVSEDMEYPGLQIIVRGAKDGYAAAMTMAEAVRQSIHGITDTTLTSTYYYRISANHSPAQLGFDGNDRPLFVINFSVIKEVT